QVVSGEVFRVIPGSLYPALHRLEASGLVKAEWGASDNNRRAKFYKLTAAGRKQLDAERETWKRFSGAGELILRDACSHRYQQKGAGMLSRLKTALRALLRRSQAEHDLDEELRYHIERQTEQNIRLGMSPEEARRAARKAFGGVEQAKERSRDARGVRWLEDLWQDLRYGARMVVKAPNITLTAVITLALGIGANTAIFSVVNAVLLRPLPFKEPAALFTVWERNPQVGVEQNAVAPGAFLDWREQNHVFEHLAVFETRGFALTGEPEAERVTGASVSTNLFRTLGVSPLL